MPSCYKHPERTAFYRVRKHGAAPAEEDLCGSCGVRWAIAILADAGVDTFSVDVMTGRVNVHTCGHSLLALHDLTSRS